MSTLYRLSQLDTLVIVSWLEQSWRVLYNPHHQCLGDLLFVPLSSLGSLTWLMGIWKANGNAVGSKHSNGFPQLFNFSSLISRKSFKSLAVTLECNGCESLRRRGISFFLRILLKTFDSWCTLQYGFISVIIVVLDMYCALSCFLPGKSITNLICPRPPSLVALPNGEFHLLGKWSVLSEHKLQIIVPFGRWTAGSLDEQSGWVKVDAWEFTVGWS